MITAVNTEEYELIKERYALAAERLGEIPDEVAVPEPYRAFFSHEAKFLVQCAEVCAQLDKVSVTEKNHIDAEKWNHSLYEELLPENYENCYGNPDYAEKVFGKEYGPLFGFLYTELRGAIVFAYENRLWDLTVEMELLLECYSAFADEFPPTAEEFKKILYWYVHDYAAEMMADRTRETLDPSLSFARDIIMNADLNDLSYLYRFGEYVTDNERKLATYLNGLSQTDIDAMAKTWTEGYRIGFEVQRKDISIKKTVNVRHRLGFERVVRAAVKQFEDMGLHSIIYRSAVHAVSKRQHIRIGYYGALPNPQFEYDHRNDAAIFTDEAFIGRKLEALRESYENCKELAAVHGGPAVMEVFGETPFVPVNKTSALTMSEKQQKDQVRYSNEAAQITNRFIPGEERSFTIIAYPVPEIGEQFEAIFRETIKINTLDYKKYQKIQQHLIDALDRGQKVRVLGTNGNQTDLTVQLHELKQPDQETNFENCVADVNIPVGEVFTSPLLTGTNGVLHVSRVYLGEFQYRDLHMTLTDGMVTDYGCGNFDSEEENRRYIEENILYHHKTLPIGEFAIGTNTTAYRMARDFDIADKLPILIAEKMGPHFAFGDTCYSWQEDMAVYNPDGKEIIARDNECSLLRKTDVSKAYFGCHTDITIPYEELGRIYVVCEDGAEIDLIRDGRFVLEGTEELNEPL